METFKAPKGRRPLYQGHLEPRRRHHHYGVLFLAVVLFVAAAVVYVERHKVRREADKLLHLGGTTTTTSPHRPTVKKVVKVAPPPLVQATVATWQLPVPVSEPLVLPGPAGELLVVGGLVSSGSSGTGAYLVGTSTGRLSLYADLANGVHDVAGADLGGEVYVFGASVIQAFAAPAHAAPPVNASTVGSLPQPRSGSVAVMVGATAYLVGGYRSQAADRQVLATSDGANFVATAKLAVPVRDAAVSAVGGQVYVFGGEALVPVAPGSPTRHWAPVSDIQHVDPATGAAKVVGHLPVPLTGSVAVNLDGHLYLAGGHGPDGWNASIWGFEPLNGHVVAAGHLAHAVSGAGSTVVGGVAWLVGGDSSTGAPVGWVQTFRVTKAPAVPPAKKP